MITLTRLNKTRLAVNCDLIERITATPDTNIHMVTGDHLVVLEPLEDVLALIEEARARVISRALSAVLEGGL